jgi:putrescine---pyruvate transaminase
MSRTPLWHGYADMQGVSRGGELMIVRGEGSWVWDADGRRYLDASASLWYCMVGHGRVELADAAAAQIRQLETYSTFGDLSNPPASELAERVASFAPFEDAAVFFTSGGSDSIDTAAKIARRYWAAIGEPHRTDFIVRKGAYHGMHAGGTSLAGIDAMASGYGQLLGGVHRVPWDSGDALAELVERVGPERIAAFVCEPVMGVGGVLAPPPGYLHAVQQICRDASILLIADEVITGFGRLGEWFGSTRLGLDPDMIVCAKGITSGYLPLGAVVASPRVSEPFYDGTVGPWRHGYTYSGHATAASVALANLRIIEREQLLARARTLEVDLAAALETLTDHPLVGDIRSGLGVLGAIRLDPQALEERPTLPAIVGLALRESGILTRALVGGEIQISPPLVLTADELEALVDGLREGLGLAVGSEAHQLR